MLEWVNQHFLLICALIIILLNYFWLSKCGRVFGFSKKAALLIAILHDIIGFYAMKLLAIIEVGGNLDKAANMRLFGAVFVLPFLYYACSKALKVQPGKMMDIAAISCINGLVMGRIDCLVGGCCKGILIMGGPLRWPLREIELVFYIGFILLFYRKILQNKTNGEVYPLYMISYGALRFILEWFREEYTTNIGILHLAHIWAILSVLIGASFYFSVSTGIVNANTANTAIHNKKTKGRK